MGVYKYTTVLERNEDGGYTVTVPALQGCVTQGDTIAEALVNAQEAIRCHLESLALLGKPIPQDVKFLQVHVEATDEAIIAKVRVDTDLAQVKREAAVALTAKD